MFLKASGSAIALAVILGCAGNRATTSGNLASPAGDPPTIAALAGEYALVTLDGHALPHAPRAAGAPARPIVSGSFLLNANGTFRLQTSYAAAGGANGGATGTCYTEGDEVKMVWDGGGLTNLTFRGDTVLLKREGTVYAYSRKR